MTIRSSPIGIRISGPLALFTRPEMKAERVSYDVITPSAARGILESILWKPQMHWIIQRIVVLKPIRFQSVKRNEVADKISSEIKSWQKQNKPSNHFYADDRKHRQQRHSLLLRDVAYRIDAVIELTALAEEADSITKYVEMFRRRLSKGQHFQQPYLGCREFPAEICLADNTEKPPNELRGVKKDLGMMLFDINYQEGKVREAVFFQASLNDGILEVPRLEEVVK